MLISLAKQLCVQVIQFQTISIFVYGAITSDLESIFYRPPESAERKELDEFIQKIEVDDIDALKRQLTKSFKGMMKAGAAKTADIMIPQE